MSQKIVQELPSLLTSPVVVSASLVMMVISRWPIVASFVDHTENTMFHLL
jgi:hypothetical protein